MKVTTESRIRNEFIIVSVLLIYPLCKETAPPFITLVCISGQGHLLPLLLKEGLGSMFFFLMIPDEEDMWRKGSSACLKGRSQMERGIKEAELREAKKRGVGLIA